MSLFRLKHSVCAFSLSLVDDAGLAAFPVSEYEEVVLKKLHLENGFIRCHRAELESLDPYYADRLISGKCLSFGDLFKQDLFLVTVLFDQLALEL